MLRALVLALLLANLGWYAWTQGWWPAGWLPPADELAQREPRRLAAQVRPDAIRIGNPSEQADAAAPACLQAGPLDADAWPAAVSALAAAGIDGERWMRTPAEGGRDWLRVPEADAELAGRLRGLADAGLRFRPCR